MRFKTSDRTEPAREGRSGFQTSTRLSVLVGTAAVLAAVVVPAPPASALVSHIWPVCAPKANEGGWRYQTRSDHNPQLAVDINRGSGDDDKGRWVVASAAGTIHSKPTAPGQGYGKQVILKHGEGEYTQYAHLNWQTSLKPGTRVVKGQLIGTIGKTGTAQYHLHYEQRRTPTGSLRKVRINGSQIGYPDTTRGFVPTHVSPSC